ncbi:MAG: histidinol dehydrogenase [Clostridia bacterium]|nr:histidinol dehydrogenase [Clostridia bacterium]
MIPILRGDGDLSRVFGRSQLDMESARETVKAILQDVRQNGDKALFAYTKKFDKLHVDAVSVAVTEREIENAYAAVDSATLAALRRAKDNIEAFHKRQKRQDSIVTENGKTTGILYRPVERAGLYVPGGKASYPSSVLMCALPAAVAGVPEIVMATPAGNGLNPLTLVAAAECGVRKIFKIGGAQAIAAMAYGTQSVPKVSVISGPGNIYVALAKREIFGAAGIDTIAGPSEIAVIADDSADPVFVAADMLSQAEHDELAMSLLITDSKTLAEKVQAELARQLQALPKADIATRSLQNYGAVVLVENAAQAASIANKVAPEHLELCVKDPAAYLPLIVNAGAVFLGHWSPEPLGDYYAGTNHVLPTSGTARFCSALGVDNYVKKISLIQYGEQALMAAADDIIALAEAEGLHGHANSVRVRKGGAQ